MALMDAFETLPLHQSFRIELLDATSVGAARRACAEMSKLSSLDDGQRGRLALIVTEAANNAIRYAQQGEIVLRREAHAVDVLVLDRGPGMANVQRYMEDGFSTGGTRGAGLSSLERQADTFALHSALDVGTAIFARVGKAPAIDAVGAVCLPVLPETQCGDAWTVRTRVNGDMRFVVADGLGHGPQAADASKSVIDAIDQTLDATPVSALGTMHVAAHGTRGAAAAVVDVRAHDGSVTFTGVGNIGGMLAAENTSRSLTSHNGIVGSRMMRTQTFEYAWNATSVLIIYSDGLQTRLSLTPYPGLAQQHPNLIAGVLYRDFARGRDDVTVVVYKPEAR